uniref:RNA-directed RNA polymerase n=1 Tax=Leviviridae sp. TaxID=2027243 RepID=A0A514D549_9VIRU|nr:MAG: RNA-dependent RNA polymerase [Leviviridae sp.]
MTTLPFSSDLKRITLALCEGVNSPRALTVAILLRYEEWGQIASLRTDPRHYADARAYRDAVIPSDFLRKLEDLPTGVDRRRKAISTFYESEHKCLRTNIRLSKLRDGYYADADLRLFEVISDIRKVIAAVLGKPPEHVKGRFGPGATFDDKGKLSTVPDKMSSQPTLYRDSLGWLFQWGETAWARALAENPLLYPKTVRGNRFTTVPKDAEKYRGICVESSISGFYQLGMGRHIRRRLRLFGVDLEHGQEIHRQVACEASSKGHLATLDLSNASDTVSLELVRLLLPQKWAELLESLRAPYTLIEGEWVRLEKFSSMGNGFTFELETLLFFAISLVASRLPLSAAHEKQILVYGDDIIVPTRSASDVIAALAFFGFQTNERKTFVDGPFRESCGGDFYAGTDVRPFYVKESPREPQDYIKLANGIRRLGRSDEWPGSLDPRYRIPWLRALDCIPTGIRSCRGPESLGDIVIHDVEEAWAFRWRHSIRYFRCYRPASFGRVGWEHFRPSAVLASAVYGTGDGRLGVTPRDSVLGYKLGWVPFS